jgi:peptidoglycan hydrolase-like protein with peptidoglycan-binding domain
MNTQITLTLSLPILRKGDTAHALTIRRVQQMLDPFVSHGEEGTPVHHLHADGVFDTETETAVKGFQDMQVGLVEPIPVTGVVDQTTWNKLLTLWLSGEEPG